jgi:hypothetical protein
LVLARQTLRAILLLHWSTISEMAGICFLARLRSIVAIL